MLINLLNENSENLDFKTPIAPSFGFHKNIVNGIKLRGRINQNFRVPTYNDRYWIGPYSKGNLDLIPEEGWNQEIGIDLRFLNINFNITYYSLLIDNMIFWNQENGIWGPVNLRKVLSKGLEFKSVIENNSAYGNFIMVFNYHYNSASNKDSINNFDNSPGKQLRYTPKHKGNISMTIIESNLKLSLIHSYTGKVFTNSDESDFLKPYSLTDVSMSYKFKKYFDFTITAKNILNKKYQSYQGYPNPGKNYLLTLNYNL